jgi:hypothetical protein
MPTLATLRSAPGQLRVTNGCAGRPTGTSAVALLAEVHDWRDSDARGSIDSFVITLEKRPTKRPTFRPTCRDAELASHLILLQIS